LRMPYMRSQGSCGGVPSPLQTTASICTKVSIGIAETPTVVIAGRSLLKNIKIK